MFNRFIFVSSALRAAGLFAFTSVAAASLALGGCVGEHQIGAGVGGSDSTSSSTGSTMPGSATSGGGAATQPIEYSIAQITEFYPQVQTQQWLLPGEKLEASTRIMVFIAEGGQSCLSPISFDTNTSHHELIVGLPLELMKVGTYDFSSSDVIAFQDTWLTDGMGNGGGGKLPLETGTVEILSVDLQAGIIKVRLTGLTQDLASFNGDFTVRGCASD